jgi:hypothetical protein
MEMRKSQNMTACPLFARTVGPEFTAANHVYPLEKKAGFGSFFVKIYQTHSISNTLF